MKDKGTTSKTEIAEKPVVSITLDIFKKEIDENNISVSISASVTGDKKGLSQSASALNKTVAHMAADSVYGPGSI